MFCIIEQTISRDAIEDIVWGILRQQGILRDEIHKDKEIQDFAGIRILSDKDEERQTQNIQSHNIVSNDMRAMISKTLSAFRSE